MYVAKDHNPALAALLTLGSAARAAGTTLLAKALGTGALGPEMHAAQISHGRFRFALFSFGCVALMMGARFTRVHRRFHVARSRLGWDGGSLMFADAFIPLSDATAITFLSPVFGMIPAVPLLGERVRPVRWSAAGIILTGAGLLAWREGRLKGRAEASRFAR